jgi:hypothetical protein
MPDAALLRVLPCSFSLQCSDKMVQVVLSCKQLLGGAQEAQRKGTAAGW